MLKATPFRALTTAKRLPGLAHAAVGVDRIPDDLLHRRKAAKRLLLDARNERRAMDTILTLPLPGESLHMVVDGLFEPCDMIPATRRLSDPAIIDRLTITTLGLNRDNTACIARGMDQGKIGTVTLLVAHYFAKCDKDEYAYLQKEICGRGGRVAAMRTHSKIILMEMSNGNFYTIEGSANLRSCRTIEQMVMTNDEQVHRFHCRWIEDYMQSRGDGKDLSDRRGTSRK